MLFIILSGFFKTLTFVICKTMKTVKKLTYRLLYKTVDGTMAATLEDLHVGLSDIDRSGPRLTIQQFTQL